MEKGRFRIGLAMTGSGIRAEHSVDPDQFEPGVPETDQPRYHEVRVGLLQWDLDAQFGVHRRFAFELSLPIRVNTIDATFFDINRELIPDFDSIHHRDETIAGLGDMTLGGRVGVVLPQDVPRWTFALRAGVSLPTGNTEANPFERGDMGLRHQHMFFGSGVVQPLLGFDTNVAFDRWTLLGWGLGRVAPYESRRGYRPSTIASGGVGVQSTFGLQRWAFMVAPEVYFETPARWDGSAARNSGRTSLIATAGAFVTVGKAWQLYALAKVPYYSWTQGGQLRWPLVGVVGVNFWFDVVKDKHAH